MSDHSIDPKPSVPSRVRDLTGQVFGRLTVVEFAGHIVAKTQRNASWRCRCECGGEIVTRAQWLQRGNVISCGCRQVEIRSAVGDQQRTHGMFRSPEYTVWQNMKKRCLDTSYRRYPDYGGRGVTICARWLESFQNFIDDMGPRPSPKHSIERKDNAGNYEPSNCCWAARVVQDRNKRTNHVITYNGETMVLQAWAERTGICYETIRARIAKGWNPEQALTTPPNPSRQRFKREVE